MSRMLAAQRALTTPGWIKSDIGRKARALPSLDLRFAERKSLVDATSGAQLVTFTRASSGTYVDSQGVIRTATTNEPRFDHNPTTGESLGLLVEEQRTNSIRNNTMVGAVAGTPGTLPTNWTGGAATDLTREVVGTGVEKGITYIDIRFTGTVNAARTQYIFFEPNGSTAASAGQTWTGSLWLKVAAGSLTNIASIAIQADTRDSSFTYVSTPFTSSISATATLSRYSSSGTTIGATTAWIQPFLMFITASSGSIDITLRIGLPQLEQGAFATSVIPTSGTAATRSADVASISGSNFSSWYRQDEGTVFFDGRFNTVAAQTAIVSLNNSAAPISNRSSLRLGNSIITSNGVQVASFNQTPALQAIAKYAYGYAVDNFAQVLNSTTTAVDTSGALPDGVNTMEIGKVESYQIYSNGTIRRLTYFPQRLSNNVLQELTR